VPKFINKTALNKRKYLDNLLSILCSLHHKNKGFKITLLFKLWIRSMPR
jgi:hypothetical protein